jgi:N-sulfoglucosamine sulfohydrolase
MKKTNLLVGISVLGCATPWIDSPGAAAQQITRPNILLITVDDMNYNTVGVFGSPVAGITPNIDRLAREGMMFRHGFVQAGASQPSRGTLLTGLYGYNSGVEGFNFIPEDSPVRSGFEILQQAGYYTGIMAKLGHCFPKRSGLGKVDMSVSEDDLVAGRDPAKYYQYSVEFFNRTKGSGKPFFLMANSQDPHRPFWGSVEEQNRRNTGKTMYGDNPTPYPSRIIEEEELNGVPLFLPDLPDIRVELTQYYNNVRRADDIVGEVLRALEESGMADNTLIVFLSDNGMSFPFSKTNCYLNSNKTPLIIKWPGVVEPGRVEEEAMVSAVDFIPTVLDITSLKTPPYKLDGVSFKDLLYGKKWNGPEYVYTFFEANSGGNAETMRSIQNRDFAYIFSPWSDGERIFKSETTAGLSFKAMQREAPNNAAIARRVEFFQYRAVEEFYDLRTDPDATVNLVNDPAYAGEVSKFRGAMEAKMRSTGDHALEAFNNRYNPGALKIYMAAQQEKANRIRKY